MDGTQVSQVVRTVPSMALQRYEGSRLEHLPSLHANLLYLDPTATVGKPRSIEFDPPPGVPRTTAVYKSHEVEIRDLRPIASQLSVDREGFELLEASDNAASLPDEASIPDTYYPEAIELVKQATGARNVVVFDHTVRKRIAGASDRASGVPRQPVPRVHNDYTVHSGRQRVRDLMGAEATRLLQRRFAVINVWRPLRRPIDDSPLAVCDARSVGKGDLVATDLIYRDRVGEIYYARFNPSHRWFYASAMRPTEVLLIKCYDSEEDGRARFVPHSAFIDPRTPADAPPRESIELRTLAFF